MNSSIINKIKIFQPSLKESFFTNKYVEELYIENQDPELREFQFYLEIIHISFGILQGHRLFSFLEISLRTQSSFSPSLE